MGSLQNQLAKVGLVSEQEVRKAKALEDMEQEAVQRLLQKKVMAKHANTLDDLRDAPTIREFRDRVRKLLVERPDLVDQVIRLAHQFKDQQGGKKLVWQVFSVRDRLRSVTPNERDRLLRRAFRNHGSTMEVPELSHEANPETEQ